MRSDEDVDCIRQAFIWNTRTSFSQASADLQKLQMTVHIVLWKSLGLKPHKSQVVQKLAAHGKQLRSQFVAHLCAHILEHCNSLSHLVFTHEAEFHISELVSQHNYAILVSEPPRERSEHEWDRPKVNIQCMLVICCFIFDKDIVTSNSFLDVLKNYARLHLDNNNNNNNNSLILQLNSAFDHYAYIVLDLT
jgi:hypothetical protein